MSNIGKQPIIVPDGVDVNINGTNIKVKGSLGELDLNFDSSMIISYDNYNNPINHIGKLIFR